MSERTILEWGPSIEISCPHCKGTAYAHDIAGVEACQTCNANGVVESGDYELRSTDGKWVFTKGTGEYGLPNWHLDLGNFAWEEYHEDEAKALAQRLQDALDGADPSIELAAAQKHANDRTDLQAKYDAALAVIEEARGQFANRSFEGNVLPWIADWADDTSAILSRVIPKGGVE